MKVLNRRKRVSLDDERDYSNFNINVYKKDFVDNSETANNVQSVLSAMITQIETENSFSLAKSQEKTPGMDMQQRSEVDDNTTMGESLDDLFDEFSHEVHCNLKLADRGADPVQEKSLAETLETRHNRGIEIHEEDDKTLEVQQTIPLSLMEKESQRLKQISTREKEVL